MFTADLEAATLAAGAFAAFLAVAFVTGGALRATPDPLALAAFPAAFPAAFWPARAARGESEVAPPWRRSARPIRPTVAITTPFLGWNGDATELGGLRPQRRQIYES
ncbi:MAG: hypothetical protein M3N95_03825 [Actinomycetota bacterium]|nr:hypothetical protein [Actinomycetota bacterium]